MRRQTGGNAWRTRERRDRVERLERRVLLSAGDLDATFGGGDGIAITDFGGTEKALDVALLPPGQILVAGTRGVMRFGADGTLDRTFGGGDGRANLTVDATALAVQSDGGILAVRSGEIVRFTPDGTRDMTFGGGDGIASAPAGVGPLVDVGVQPSGRIVAVPAGFIGLVGFDPTGRLDTTFGRGGSNGGGVVEADLPAPWRSTHRSGGALAVQPDGYVVVAGSVDSDISRYGIWQGLAAARFTPDGLFDPAFGLTRIDGGEVWHTASDVALAPDGRIGVVGRFQRSTSDPRGTDTVYRLLPTGAADATFGSDGRAGAGDLFNDPYTAHPPPAIAATPDGKLVVAGVANVGTADEPRLAFGVFRFNRDGTPDPTFGPDHDGGVTTVIGRSSIAYGLAVQPDGKVLAVGTADGNVAMARYQGDGSLDATFGGDGTITTDFDGSYGDFAQAAVLLPNGKVLVAGARAMDDIGSAAPSSVGPALTESHNELFLGRFNPDGSLDPAFGDHGKVFVQRPDSWVEQVRALVVLPDGSFVVSFGATLYRFSAGGARLGSVTTVDAGGISVGAALAVQPGGKVLVAPFAGPNLARLNPDLSLDCTFGGGDGLAEMSNSPPRSIVVGPDGNILVTGHYSMPYVGTFAGSTRYLPDGTYDLAQNINWGDTIDVPNDAAVSGDDRFFLALGTDAPNVDAPSRFAVAGYRGGRLDFDFGTQSVATFPYAPPTPPMGAADSANAAAMDSLGRVVVAGSVKGDFAVARFLV